MTHDELSRATHAGAVPNPAPAGYFLGGPDLPPRERAEALAQMQAAALDVVALLEAALARMDDGLELDRHDVAKVRHRLKVNITALRRLHIAAGKEIVRLGRLLG